MREAEEKKKMERFMYAQY